MRARTRGPARPPAHRLPRRRTPTRCGPPRARATAARPRPKAAPRHSEIQESSPRRLSVDRWKASSTRWRVMIVRPGHRMQASIVLLVLALGAAVLGCTEKLVEPPPPPVVLGVPDSIQQIFAANCALPQCHAGPTPQQGQDLRDAVTSFNLIVGVASHEKPAF